MNKNTQLHSKDSNIYTLLEDILLELELSIGLSSQELSRDDIVRLKSRIESIFSM